MIIKEGSILNIIDGLDDNNLIIEKIVAQEDIRIENNGEGYTFLLRYEGHDRNCIFEADKIVKKENEFIVKGYFKDAILVIRDRNKSSMHESYLDFD
ncbi:hypothetical protein QCF18_15120 [Staphylococcus aureus]|uniref:hypothetical protein n=1 Tax=Clostridium perfringens TaxID=1502 RepID=UPI001CCEDE30|nr:hypothetical protein [Clostridium perfringens]MDG6614165.1 hypothetical protein [Staphylococcus aureus]MDK0754771.1 hypothetical protein [Clostridium perfringens]MDK0757994.1 hypothetical protein [Clostridium perfringens]UBK45641.1 hypothetical protein KLF41_00500 [Clostridium perfringens]UBK54338.1 hypothetical protein KLF42_14690 [Clostridium perfringens]